MPSLSAIYVQMEQVLIKYWEAVWNDELLENILLFNFVFQTIPLSKDGSMNLFNNFDSQHVVYFKNLHLGKMSDVLVIHGQNLFVYLEESHIKIILIKSMFRFIINFILFGLPFKFIFWQNIWFTWTLWKQKSIVESFIEVDICYLLYYICYRGNCFYLL